MLFVFVLSKTTGRSPRLQSVLIFLQIFFMTNFKNLLKELTTTMTHHFTGRLQFTGKKHSSARVKAYFGLLQLDLHHQTALLRYIIITAPPETV
jgi:hypothetical protein